MVLQMVVFHSFSWLSNIPCVYICVCVYIYVCIYIYIKYLTSSLSLQLLVDIYVVSMSWLLSVALLWI